MGEKPPFLPHLFREKLLLPTTKNGAHVFGHDEQVETPAAFPSKQILGSPEHEDKPHTPIQIGNREGLITI